MNEQDLTLTRIHDNAKGDGFLKRMAEVLAEEKVKKFFRDYFSTWSDAKTALMMMQTFVIIDEGYFQSTGTRLPSEEVSAIVRQVITDRECRPVLVEAMKEFMSGGEEKFFDTFQRIAAPTQKAVALHAHNK